MLVYPVNTSEESSLFYFGEDISVVCMTFVTKWVIFDIKNLAHKLWAANAVNATPIMENMGQDQQLRRLTGRGDVNRLTLHF